MHSATRATFVPTLPVDKVDPWFITLSATRGAISLADLRAYMPAVRRNLLPDEALYRAGQAVRALYLVQAGSLQTSGGTDAHERARSALHIRGELIGVESIGSPTYSCDAIAIEQSSVWELPYPDLLSACANIPALEAQLTMTLAAQLCNDGSWMRTLQASCPDHCVAAFLLETAARARTIGLVTGHVMRMTRSEIGALLGLEHEIVTRSLTRLAAQGCIRVRWREVSILDSQALQDTLECAAAH